MHKTIQNLIDIQKKIQSKVSELNYSDYYPKIIAVSKTFKIDHLMPIIQHGHIHFGENKVQEALDKWSEVKSKNINIKLHMVGKLQTNKVKFAIKIFDYFHSVDNIKLAKKIGTKCVEFHTGQLSTLIKKNKKYKNQLKKFSNCVNLANSLNLRVHAGHGMDYKTTRILSSLKSIYDARTIGNF